MDSSFSATRDALDYFDEVDAPAVEALRTEAAPSIDLAGFVAARKRAADRVRAAFLKDTLETNTEENVELMSVDRIRQAIGGTFLGKLLKRLP